jgi:hypothetical protein
MKPTLRAVVALFATSACLQVHAHEFWAAAAPFTPSSGAQAAVTLHVGEYFSGDLVGINAAQTSALRLYSKDGPLDLMKQLPQGKALPELQFLFPHAGEQLVVYDSVPSTITLPAEKFHAYLHDEGLDAIIRQREAAGKAGEPGRERYRRNVKTLLRVGGKSDASYGARSGQRLEIVPLADPYAKTAGESMTFALSFDGKPLAGALMRAWYKHDGQTLSIRARSDAQGKLSFTLPYAGMWMFSIVHMVPVIGVADIDWDSYWGNFSFELPAR